MQNDRILRRDNPVHGVGGEAGQRLRVLLRDGHHQHHLHRASHHLQSHRQISKWILEDMVEKNAETGQPRSLLPQPVHLNAGILNNHHYNRSLRQ